MTSLKEIIDLMLPKIPLDMRSDEMIDIELARTGLMDMASALDFPSLTFEKTTEPIFNNDTGEYDMVDSEYVVEDIDFKQKRLAAYYAYGSYLERLKLAYTNDAINFNTLTFAIKGLEKRPEAINDSIYMWNRYLKDEISKAKGSSVVIGIVKQFGSDSL